MISNRGARRPLVENVYQVGPPLLRGMARVSHLEIKVQVMLLVQQPSSSPPAGGEKCVWLQSWTHSFCKSHYNDIVIQPILFVADYNEL